MKRVAVSLLILIIFFFLIPPAQAVTSPSLPGMEIYPRDHIWNVPIDTLPVDTMSETYIKSSGASANLYVYEGYRLNIVDKNTPVHYFSSFRYMEGSDYVPYPVPANPLIETRSKDHSLLIVQPDANYFYQIFDAQKNADGTWSGGSGAVFNLSSYEPGGWLDRRCSRSSGASRAPQVR